jgi:hypothetical protein
VSTDDKVAALIALAGWLAAVKLLLWASGLDR